MDDNFNFTESLSKIGKSNDKAWQWIDGFYLLNVIFFPLCHIVVGTVLAHTLTYLYFVNLGRLEQIKATLQTPGVALLTEHCVENNYTRPAKYLAFTVVSFMGWYVFQSDVMLWIGVLFAFTSIKPVGIIIGYTLSIATLGQLITLKDVMPADQFERYVTRYSPPLMQRRVVVLRNAN